jgi:phage terminase small subunit
LAPIAQAYIQAAIEARARGEAMPPRPPRKGSGVMNARQKRFAEEYLVVLNAREAAIRAGYSARTAPQIGSYLLTHPLIAAAIRDGAAARSERTGLTGDQVLAAFAEIAYFDLARLLDWGPDGATLKPSATLNAGDRMAIAELNLSVGKKGVTNLHVRLQDRQRALDSLARHFLLYGRNAAPVTAKTISPEEAKRAREKLRERFLTLVEQEAKARAAMAAEKTKDATPANVPLPKKTES